MSVKNPRPEDVALTGPRETKSMEGLVLRLAELSIGDFIEELGKGTPTPGGGSVAALCGALGAALSAMVARLTVGRERFRGAWERMERVRKTGDQLAGRFLELMQQDSDAYRGVIAARRLPKETAEQRASRQAAIQEAMKGAAKVPLETLRVSERLVTIAEEAVRQGNPVTLTDAGAAVQLAQASAAIAAYNVRINLCSVEDEAFVEKYNAEVEDTLARVKAVFEEADKYLNRKIS